MGLLTTLEKKKTKKTKTKTKKQKQKQKQKQNKTKNKKLDHPKKNTWTPLITIELIKNKIQPLQNFCPLNVEKKILRNIMFITFLQYFCNKS